MVGAAAALGFARQGRKVAVIDSGAPHAFEPSQPMDVRVSAISQTSVALLEELGAWSSVVGMRACPYRHLETWEHPECRTRFSCESLGLPQLGYMVENRVIQLALWQQFAAYPQLTLMCPEQLAQLNVSAEGCRVTLQSGAEIECDWVIGADGANSQVRQLAHIGVTAWDYRQHCMLINVQTEQIQQETTWQQFFQQGRAPTYLWAAIRRLWCGMTHRSVFASSAVLIRSNCVAKFCSISRPSWGILTCCNTVLSH